MARKESAAGYPDLGRARRVVVKVGTSLLTHPGGQLHFGRMEALVRQLVDLHGEGREVILVSSGAVAAGMGRLGLPARPPGLPEKQALAAVGQGLLMQHYEKLFGEYGVTVAQVLLTREDIEDPRRRQNAATTLGVLLGWRAIPVVNENDTVTAEEIRVGDNDSLSARVAVLSRADLLVILSDVEGVYPADPRLHPGLEPLARITELSDALWHAAGGAGTPSGTGGMQTKLQAAALCMGAGIPMVVASGYRPGILSDIARGQVPGTLFVPHKAGIASA